MIRRRPGVVIVVAAVACAGWWLLASQARVPAGASTALGAETSLDGYLTDRPFFDKFPLDPRRTYYIYMFTKKRTGAFIVAEGFRQVIEIFFYKALGGKLYYWFPHTKARGSTPYRLTECRGPGTFDLKLEMSSDPKLGNKPRVFYSWKKYKDEGLPSWVVPAWRSSVLGD